MFIFSRYAFYHFLVLKQQQTHCPLAPPILQKYLLVISRIAPDVKAWFVGQSHCIIESLFKG